MFRRLAYGLVIFIVFEGALRKWIAPSISTEIYLFKFVLLYAIFILFVGNYSSRLLEASCLDVNIVSIWFLWLALFTCFFLTSGFSIISLAGAAYYLLPIPFVFIFAALFQNEEHFSQLAIVYLIIAIAIGFLGFLQYASPPDSILNIYVAGEVGDVAVFGVDILGQSRARITGTFSYITSYTMYLQFAFPLACASLLNARTNSAKTISAIAAVVVLANVAMTGSRGPFLIVIVSSIPFLISAFIHRSRTKSGSRLQNLVVIIIIAVSFPLIAIGAIGGIQDRNEGAGDGQIRAIGAFLMPYATLRDCQAFGEGLGSTAYNVAQFSDTFDKTSTTYEEIFHDKIGIETGYIGYAFALFVKAYFLVWTLLSCYRSNSVSIKRWLLVPLVFQLSTLSVIPVHAAVGFFEYLACISMTAWLNKQARVSRP